MNCCWLHYSSVDLFFIPSEDVGGKSSRKVCSKAAVILQHCCMLLLKCFVCLVWRARKKRDWLSSWDKKVTAELHFLSLSRSLYADISTPVYSHLPLSLFSPEKNLLAFFPCIALPFLLQAISKDTLFPFYWGYSRYVAVIIFIARCFFTTLFSPSHIKQKPYPFS